MEALPSYVCVEVSGYGESFDPSVQVTEMERGPPKMARINSRVQMNLRASLLFMTNADAVAFENWYFDAIQRVGEFTMEHPRTGATITAWFQGGSIGTLAPVTNRRQKWRRDVVIEYMR